MEKGSNTNRRFLSYVLYTIGILTMITSIPLITIGRIYKMPILIILGIASLVIGFVAYHFSGEAKRKSKERWLAMGPRIFLLRIFLPVIIGATIMFIVAGVVGGLVFTVSAIAGLAIGFLIFRERLISKLRTKNTENDNKENDII